MLDRIFREARTHGNWQGKPVSDDLLRQLYDLMKWAPTSMNASPARFLFLRTPEAKGKLVPLMSSGNQEKTATAPVTVIIGQDLEFYERLPALFPQRPEARNMFTGDDKQALARETAFRNSSMQGAYLILAARSLGLHCGPMSGFNAAAVDDAFWAGTTVRTNFICNLGYGDPELLFDRLPRLPFDEACKLL